MKISIHDLKANEVLRTEIEGSEEWLEPIYQEFPKASQDSRVRGYIDFIKAFGDNPLVDVSGHLEYSTKIECPRCSETLTWSINENWKQRFKFIAPEINAQRVEIDLTFDQLDELELYTDFIELLDIVQETLALALPSSGSDLHGDNACPACKEGSSASYVEKDRLAQNPFAKLRDFKCQSE